MLEADEPKKLLRKGMEGMEALSGVAMVLRGANRDVDDADERVVKRESV